MNKEHGIPWKAILGFLMVFGGQLYARATVGGVEVLPETMEGWLTLFVGSFVGAWAIYAKGNTYTVEQAEEKLEDAISRQRA